MVGGGCPPPPLRAVPGPGHQEPAGPPPTPAPAASLLAPLWSQGLGLDPGSGRRPLSSPPGSGPSPPCSPGRPSSPRSPKGPCPTWPICKPRVSLLGGGPPFPSLSLCSVAPGMDSDAAGGAETLRRRLCCCPGGGGAGPGEELGGTACLWAQSGHEGLWQSSGRRAPARGAPGPQLKGLGQRGGRSQPKGAGGGVSTSSLPRGLRTRRVCPVLPPALRP